MENKESFKYRLGDLERSLQVKAIVGELMDENPIDIDLIDKIAKLESKIHDCGKIPYSKEIKSFLNRDSLRWIWILHYKNKHYMINLSKCPFCNAELKDY